jgi:hypothetical protein
MSMSDDDWDQWRESQASADTQVLNAYYFSFEPTGVEAIDAILAAVAQAGEAYHHTESWSEPGSDGLSEVDRIQAAADAAADHMRDPDEVTP